MVSNPQLIFIAFILASNGFYIIVGFSALTKNNLFIEIQFLYTIRDLYSGLQWDKMRQNSLFMQNLTKQLTVF